MKISNNALNFLLAQYRAIFKRAYIKGIASAVILTAGLAAGASQAQAAPSADNPFWYLPDGSGQTWQSGTTTGGEGVRHNKFAGDYDIGAKGQDGKVSGDSLVIGASGSPVNSDIVSISSGSAYGGFVELDESSTLKAEATGNKLIITSGGAINSTAGNYVGGWAKTNGKGEALASGNELHVNADSGATIASGTHVFIGAAAGAINGATAEGNKYIFTGAGSLTALQNGGNYGAIVWVGDPTHSGSTGSFIAQNNTLEMSNFTVSGDTSTLAQKTFIGGRVWPNKILANNTIDVLRAQGNTVNLEKFQIGTPAQYQSGYAAGEIVANHVVNDQNRVGLVEANGSADTGVILKNGDIYGAFVRGGLAQNISGGSATANSNIISITDTNLMSANSGASTILNEIVAGHAQSTKTGDDQKINLTASNNAISIQNESDDKDTTYQVEGSIIGAELKLLSGSAGITDLVNSNLTADNNTITIDAGINVSNGSIQGVVLDTDQGNITSGGATLHASNNTITLDGEWTTEDSKYNIATVIAQKGVLTAENNKLVIKGKVDASTAGTLIAAVVASEQGPIANKLEAGKNVHTLNNNSVEIGADAEVIRANIFASQSTQTSAHTLNNDVTVAGKVTNSDIYGGTGADSVVAAQAGSRLSYNDDVNHQIRSDVVDLAGIVDVGQTATLKVGGFLTDGNINAGTYNTNQTTIKSTAELYNRKEVELLGDTTVEAGAKLHALIAGAKIKVNGDVGGSTIKTTNNLGYDFVGGRGQLTISKAQLQSYLTSGDSYTLDTRSGTDKAGTVEVTSGGVLEFTDSNIDLATLDYSNTDVAGKIYVAKDPGSAILKGDAVTVSHALVSDYAAASKLDFSKEADYNTLKTLAIDASGVSIEANDLILGSSRINAKQSEDIKFEKATAKDSINFTVGSGTFTLTSKVAGNNYMHTNNLDSDLEYFTALNGTITGDVDVVSGGELTIEYGHWTAQDDIELVADSATGGALTVGIDNSDSNARNYIDKGNAKALPDATLVLDQALTVNLSGAGTATVTVDGKISSGYSYADGEHNRLYVYDEQLAQSTVGDDHYVMLDLRNGLDVIGDANDNGKLKGKFELTAQSGGVVKMMADDLNALLVQNNTKVNDVKSGSQITISDKAHLQVTGDVEATFRDFGQVSGDNGIKLDDGVMSANSLSLIHDKDSNQTQEDATYIASGANKIDFGSSTGTVAVKEVVINDLQRVTKPDDSTSDNSYASEVVFARGTLDIGENLSSINDTLVVGVAEGTATEANLDFYGADIVEGASGAADTINVDTVRVANGTVSVLNGAWEGNAFDLGASGDMVIGGSEDDRANLTAQSLKMAQGSLLDVLAT
ncbi:MAG: hypothetical protein ROM54_02215, partial [Anaerobiospirillum sp.]|nr:hypothetical protein [Anaerobiospirillum sp.]